MGFVRFSSFICFVLFCFQSNAQERINKNGRIAVRNAELKGIEIANLNTNQTVYSEKGGYFKIPITLNDTLVFSSDNFLKTYIIITQEDMRSRFLYVSLESNETTLEDLVIDNSKNSSSYFEAKVRRRGLYKDLYTATSGGPIASLINLLSGRTQMIKKAIELEKQNDLADQMVSSMSESYFVEELKIPKDKIGGFGYYLLDDYDVNQAVKTRNEFQLQFLLPLKAKMYLEKIKE